MKIVAVNTIKTGGKYYDPGACLDAPDSVAASLLNSGAARPYIEPVATPEPAPAGISDEEAAALAEELLVVKGISKSIAMGLVKVGIQDIEALKARTPEDLCSLGIRGLDMKKASVIIADVKDFGPVDA